jgi:hypothetical protein
MKTEMQELLGLFEQMFNNAKTIEIESSMNDVINIITQEGLPKEKEQIMDAYDAGWSDGVHSIDLNDEYYYETFDTNEK